VKLFRRLAGVAAALGIGWLVLGAGQKELVLVYDVSSVADARALEVDVLRGGEVLRHAEFRLHAGEGRVSHALKLAEGDYLLRGRIDAPGGATPFERPLEVHEAGTIVLPLGR
jgi:hypothetical protein